MIRAIVTDIEGTTSSIHFVHRVLFPYATAALPDYVRRHAQDADVAPLLDVVAAEAGLALGDVEGVIEALLAWSAEDRKHTVLKALQGRIWAAGYATAAFRAHVYPDVPPALAAWQAAGWPLYVYSSGSVQAQQLFFGHTEAGDLLPRFSGFFDTTSGGKRVAQSYRTIAEHIGEAPAGLLFLSDVVEELDAARTAGWQTCLLLREAKEMPAAVNGHHCVGSFADIDPARWTETHA